MPGSRSVAPTLLGAPGPAAVHPQAPAGAHGLGHRLGARCDGCRPDLVHHRRAGGAVEPASRRESAWIASVGFMGMAIGASLGGLLADRFGRRQVFAVTLRDLRAGDRGVRPRRRARRAAGAALPRRARARGGAPGGVDLRERARTGAHARPADRHPRGVLGGGLDGRRADRLPRHPGLRERLALGVRARRAARGLRARRALGAAGVGAVARATRSARRGGGGRAALRGVRGRRCRQERRMPRPRHPSPHRPSQRAERLAALWYERSSGVRTACLWLVWFCVNFSYYGAFIWIPTILVAAGLRPRALLRLHARSSRSPSCRATPWPRG